MGLYIPSAPVEEKGYMNIINLPEYPKTQDNSPKSINRREVSDFFSPIRALFFFVYSEVVHRRSGRKTGSTNQVVRITVEGRGISLPIFFFF